MRYVKSRYGLFDREQAYRIYVTDALKLVGQLNMRYADLFSYEQQETRTNEEVIEDIKAKLKALEE